MAAAASCRLRRPLRPFPLGCKLEQGEWVDLGRSLPNVEQTNSEELYTREIPSLVYWMEDVAFASGLEVIFLDALGSELSTTLAGK